MKDFLNLRANLKKDYSTFPKVKVAILGDTSTQFLKQMLYAYGFEIQVDFEIYEADYNQIDLQVFNPDSDFYRFNPQFAIVFNSYHKLFNKFYGLDFEKRKDFADYYLQHSEEIYRMITEKTGAKVIFLNLFEYNDMIFGNFSNKLNTSFIYQIKKINLGLMDLGSKLKNMFILDLNFLQSFNGFKTTFDSRLYINSDVAFSLDFLPLVVKNLSDIILSILGVFKKCVILDLDNTLWGGVIGDDGLDKIQLGSLGVGKAFSEFQLWLKQLKERGIILAICSKNEEDIAKEPFEKHPEMILRLEDISIFVANWNNKVDNLKYIQNVLNVGFDSMVFIDDNPIERELVKSYIPEISVPELPEDPSDYLYYLQSLNLFETASFSGEDAYRTKLYREEASRKVDEISFKNYEEFLGSLNMRCEVKPFDEFNSPRVAQLTQRSNQFNLRTVRYTEAEILNISKSTEHLTFAFSLSDKYGDYGLVSIIILEINDTTLFIDSFIMSCRVLKRTLENFILNHLHEAAIKLEAKRIVGEYIPTKKNVIVKNLYDELGFIQNDKLWELDIQNYEKRNSAILLL